MNNLNSIAADLGLKFDFAPFTTEYASDSSPNGLPLFSVYCTCHTHESRVDLAHDSDKAEDAAWQIVSGHNFDVNLSDIVIRVLA